MGLPASDIIGFVLFASFGLWWLLLPRSVVRFYAWFHRGRYKPSALGVYRVVGALWIVLILLVEWNVFGRVHSGN